MLELGLSYIYNYIRNNMSFCRIIFLSLLLFTNLAQAYDDFRVTLRPSGQYALLSFELDPGAKLYWRHPGELGLPTKFGFEHSRNLDNAQVLWPVPISFEKSYVYENKVSFPIKVKEINPSQNIFLELQADFTICAEGCKSYNLNLSTIVAKESEMLEETFEALNKTPTNKEIDFKNIDQISKNGKDFLEVRFTYPGKIDDFKLFLDLPDYVNFSPTNYAMHDEGDIHIIEIPITFSSSKQELEYAYIALSLDNNKSAEYEYILDKTETHSFLLIILYALLGGLILNIMPCVLPIIGLKLLQITKLSQSDLKMARYELLAQSAGIVFCFIILAIITYGLKQFGIQAGLGMHFQQPAYLITMVIILSVIAMNLLAKSEVHIQVPSFLMRMVPVNKRGILGFFFSGILAAMLATPCTAPFITIAAGFALTTDFISMMTIFIFIGIGMSSPYIAIAMSPKMNKFLPKPGNWMQQFKKFLAMIILATSLWMIYVISTQLGWVAAVVLFAQIILIKFVITENILNKTIKILVLFILLSLCYILPYHLYEDDLRGQNLEDEVWQEYKQDQVLKLIEKGHVVVIDITASWCATCNINKLTTLNSAAVLEYMKNNNVIGMRASVNKSGDNSPQILTLMRMYKHYGVPFNVIYSKKFPTGKVLSTMLLPNMFIESIKEAKALPYK